MLARSLKRRSPTTGCGCLPARTLAAGTSYGNKVQVHHWDGDTRTESLAFAEPEARKKTGPKGGVQRLGLFFFCFFAVRFEGDV